MGNSRELVDTLARTPLNQIVLLVAVLTALRCVTFYFLRNHPRRARSFSLGFLRFANETFDSFAFAGVFVFLLIRPFGFQAFLIPTGSMWPEIPVNGFIVANKLIYRFRDPQSGEIVVFHPPVDAALSPADLDASGDMKFDFVKRCIGVPGDLVEVIKGVVYRNGKAIDEPYKGASACMDDPNHCQNYRALSADEQTHIMPSNFKLVNYKGRIIPLNYTNLDANAPVPIIDGTNYTDRPYSVAEKYQIPKREDEAKAMALPAQRVPAGMYLMMGDNRNNSYDGRAWGLVPRESIVGRAEFVWWPLKQIHLTR